MKKTVSTTGIKKPAKPVVPISGKKSAIGATIVTAKEFIKKLQTMASAKEAEKIQHYFKSGEGQYGAGDTFIGVRMG